MQLGLFGINMNACATTPGVLARIAVAAEAAGWESVWTGEHYVLPDPQVPPSPAPPETPMLDPFVALTVAATSTSTLLLGTGVTVVPLHQTLLLAKKIASLDTVSGGRFLFGVGVGYLEAEFRALGAPFERRGERLEQALDDMRAIWGDEGTARFGLRAEPRPAQRPGPPLHVAGYVAGSYRRAVERGHGWYGFALDLDATARCIEGLEKARADHDRPIDLPPLEISVTPHPRVALDEATVEAFAALGVSRLIPLAPPEEQALLRFVEETPARLGLAAAG